MLNILEVTYNIPRIRSEIAREVGRAFTLFQKIKLGQIGSQGLVAISFSPLFRAYFDYNETINKVNIELRPKGIIVGFQMGYRTFNWVLAFDKFDIKIEDEVIVIRTSTDMLSLSPLHRAKIDSVFIQKIWTNQKAFSE